MEWKGTPTTTTAQNPRSNLTTKAVGFSHRGLFLRGFEGSKLHLFESCEALRRYLQAAPPEQCSKLFHKNPGWLRFQDPYHGWLESPPGYILIPLFFYIPRSPKRHPVFFPRLFIPVTNFNYGDFQIAAVNFQGCKLQQALKNSKGGRWRKILGFSRTPRHSINHSESLLVSLISWQSKGTPPPMPRVRPRNCWPYEGLIKGNQGLYRPLTTLYFLRGGGRSPQVPMMSGILGNI